VTEGDRELCTAVVRPDGTWSCTPTTPLAPGQHTVTATQADAAGNTSPADTVTFTVTGGTTPDDPDPDKDGLPTTQESTLGTDPHDADTDGDGLTDGQEVTGVRVKQRFRLCGRKVARKVFVKTDPLRKDTDGDRLADGVEVRGYTVKQKVVTRKGTITIGKVRSNPTKEDTDRDGLKDKVEKTGSANERFGKARSDPTSCDTDRGGVSDGAEVKAGSDPSDYRSGPRSPSKRDAMERRPGMSG
jgi:hypothetical protein